MAITASDEPVFKCQSTDTIGETLNITQSEKEIGHDL